MLHIRGWATFVQQSWPDQPWMSMGLLPCTHSSRCFELCQSNVACTIRGCDSGAGLRAEGLTTRSAPPFGEMHLDRLCDNTPDFWRWHEAAAEDMAVAEPCLTRNKKAELCAIFSGQVCWHHKHAVSN